MTVLSATASFTADPAHRPGSRQAHRPGTLLVTLLACRSAAHGPFAASVQASSGTPPGREERWVGAAAVGLA
jgi:hypothetical protein